MMNTTAAIGNCSIEVIFPHFSKLPQDVGRNAFSPVVELMGKRWRLIFYPGGSQRAHQEYVSCFLQCLSEESTTVSFRLWLINQRQKRPDKIVSHKEITCTFKQNDHFPNDSKSTQGCHGLPSFVLRSALEARAHEFLVNDTLVIRLDLNPTPSEPCPMELVEYNFLALQDDDETTDLEIHVAIPNCDDDDEDDDADDDEEGDEENEGNGEMEKENNVEGYFVLNAHKLVLSAFSEVFKTMFYGQMEEAFTDRLMIEDFSVQAVECMLDYCYSGEVDFIGFSLDEIEEVLTLSCKYQMKGFTAKCVVYLMSMLSEMNAIQSLHVVHTLSLAEVKTAVLNFIVKHPNSVKRGARHLKTCDKDLLIEVMLKAIPTEKDGNKIFSLLGTDFWNLQR